LVSIPPIRLQAQLGYWSARPGPLYRKLADALRAGLERGEIETGMRLPPERVLARQLAVSRTTVVQAYDLLRAEDWLESRQGSGTWVRRAPASPMRMTEWLPGAPSLVMKRDAIVASLTEKAPDTIDLTCAAPPPLPGLVEAGVAASADELAAATREHGYSALGAPALRRAIARHLERRGLPTTASQVLVTSGAQQAIALLAALFVRRGETVLCESPTFLGALDALGAAGASLSALPVGPDGVRLDVLRDAVRHRPARLLYLTPTFHNPTGAVLPEGARREVARLATDASLPVIEDESLADIVLGAAPPPSIAALAPKAPVISIGSLSKLFWGGLRIGWIRAPEPILMRLASLKVAADLGSSMLSQVVAARLLERADEAKRLRRAQLTRQRDTLASGLARRLPDWTCTLPEGGLSMWARLPHGDASELTQVALRHGLSLLPGPSVSPDAGHHEFLRLVFVHEPHVLEEAVERLARAWEAYAPLARPEQRALSVIV
jgi:DNA-binding transcriptional MocR family regulator